jgi:pimeloyl-ACP methyl ester carboxylesterase
VERIVLVHGSVTGGRPTWTGQRVGLRHQFELVVLERPGFPPNPPVDSVDFEDHAEVVAAELDTQSHLVGHSYGGVVAMLAAAKRPERVRSLTVLEPPCTRVALGDPAADRFAEDGRRWWAEGPTDDPEAFMRGFLHYVGSDFDPPSPLSPELEQGARTLIVERGPWEADIPLHELGIAPFPKLVVSGAHLAAFDAICDVLEKRLRAERLVLPGHQHNPQRHPDFNGALAAFVTRAAARRASSRSLPPDHPPAK